jgi:hypothetical protein
MRGRKMKGSLAMLMKTNGEKMSDCASLAISMKTNELLQLSRDVYENIIGYATTAATIACA